MGSAIAKNLLEGENAHLAEETAEMKRQLETRKAVERAKEILQKRQNLSEEEAYFPHAQREPPSKAPHERASGSNHFSRGIVRKDEPAKL